MSLSRSLLHWFKHVEWRQGNKQFTALHAPLLDQSTILDLLYRVQGQVRQAEPNRDVAYRKLGDHRSVFRGYGLDYEESRPYQAGDEIRFMNWRASARTGELYMKVFREERRPGVFVLVDRRASMRFGTRTRLKVTQAARAAAIVAFAARQLNAPISGVMLQAEPEWQMESNDEQGAFNFVNAACAACPPLSNSQEEPSMMKILKLLQNMLISGTEIWLISDFIDLDADWRAALLHLAQEHKLCAIHIVDPAEQALPAAGRFVLHAPGKLQQQEVDTSDAGNRAAYEASASDFLKQREQMFSALAIPYVRLLTDTESIETKIFSAGF